MPPEVLVKTEHHALWNARMEVAENTVFVTPARCLAE